MMIISYISPLALLAGATLVSSGGALLSRSSWLPRKNPGGLLTYSASHEKNHNDNLWRDSCRPSSSSSILTRIRGGNISVNQGETAGAFAEETAPPSPPQQGPKILKPLHGMAFSGNLLPNIRYLLAGSTEKYGRGWKAVIENWHRGDAVILLAFSFLPVHLFRVFHALFYKVAETFGKKHKDYDESKLSLVAKILSQGGQIASVVYVVEMMVTFLVAVLGGRAVFAPKAAAAAATAPKHLIPLVKFPGLFANCAYGVWITRKVIQLKRRVFKKFYGRVSDPETYDSVMDFLIWLVGLILILETSDFDLGALVKSLVAVGGLSSIVVGLALKDPATQLLQGALMMAANKFRRNELIRLGDGTQGKVVEIGLLETTIMGGDDIHVKIPNGKLAGQKFSNISRMPRSQIKFDLRFPLYDMNRIQTIMDEIRYEVNMACPKLITDGSRPFRVLWTDIGNDHIVVTVDTHHNVPPACNAHWETREQVLFAISKAVKKQKAKFAIPVELTGPYKKGTTE